MKIGIYNPYLDTIGGGERYLLTITEHLANQNHQVDLFWNTSSIKSEVQQKLRINLGRVNFVKDIFSKPISILEKIKVTRNYQVFIYLSDGSIPLLLAKKNIIHFQVPFHDIGGKTPKNQMKLKLINQIVCNSKFTKKFIDLEFKVNSQVIYPPVNIGDFKVGKKENLILSVSRFSQKLHAKKQEILIKSFRNLIEHGLKDWRLVLAGSINSNEQPYLEYLQDIATDLPVKFYPNISYSELIALYSKAMIFWHATGFGEDENKYPEKCEHFGIVVVEAMVSGCIPLVVAKGGIPEIIDHQQNGFLWQTNDELEDQTLQLINSPETINNMSKEAILKSRQFSQKRFCKEWDEIINQ